MLKVKLYAAFTLIVIVLIVVLQNTEPVETKLLFATIIMPRAALIAITLLVGIAAGVLIALSLSKRRPTKN
jgi:uncharacterized integral membrane protein